MCKNVPTSLRIHLHFHAECATLKAKVRVLNFKYYTEKNILPYDLISNSDQSGRFWVLCVLLQAHFYEENNSQWAKSIIFTSQEEFNEADEIMLFPFRKVKTRFSGK